LNSKKLLARAVEKWPAKVLSVAVALILFVFHRMSTLETRFLSVPLQVEAGADLLPISSYPRLIRVSLRGDANSVYPIGENDIEAYIDLKKQVSGGWYRAPVQIRKRGSAVDVEPLEISVDPIEVSIQLDNKVTRTIPLNVHVRGEVETGFELVSRSFSPTQVTVEGPESVLGSVSALDADPVDLEGRSQTFSVNLAIHNKDPRLVIRGNGMAEFRGVIRQVMPAMNIDGIHIMVKGLDGRFEANLGGATGSVRVEGSQELLDKFTPPPDFLSVDCSVLREPGTYTLPVAAALPDGLVLLRSEPETLDVIVAFHGGGDR
jgi:hypothetical protein